MLFFLYIFFLVGLLVCWSVILKSFRLFSLYFLFPQLQGVWGIFIFIQLVPLLSP